MGRGKIQWGAFTPIGKSQVDSKVLSGLVLVNRDEVWAAHPAGGGGMPAGAADRAIGPFSALQGDEEAHHAHLPGLSPATSLRSRETVRGQSEQWGAASTGARTWCGEPRAARHRGCRVCVCLGGLWGE